MPAKPGLIPRLMTIAMRGLVNIKDGHAVDAAGSIGAGGGIHDVVGTDDERDVGLREVAR